MAPNKKQIAIKNAYKSHVSRALNSLSDALQEDEADRDEEEITALIDSLDIKFKKYESKATEHMEDDENEETMLAEIEEIDKLEDQVTRMKVKAHSVLKKQEVKQKQSEKKDDSKAEKKKARVKLPQVELTEFNGEDDEEEFPAFIDMFTALIDDNKDLPDVEKFHYLRKATTTGKRANRLVNAYPLCEKNYKIALQKLKEEFGDKRRLVSKHFNALLDYKVTCHNWKDLQEFYDFIETKLRCLEVLDAPVDEKNDMVITLIYRQVPEKVQMEIAKLEDEEKTITGVMKIIKTEVRANQNRDSMLGKDTSLHESYEDEKTSTEKYNRYGESYETLQASNSSAAALPVVTNGSYRSRQCPYCNNNHSALYCTEISDVNKRREIVRQTNRCFNCLFTGHQARDCKSRNSCHICKEWHHTSLCGKNVSQSHVGGNSNKAQYTTPEMNGGNSKQKGFVGKSYYQTGGYHTAASGWCRRGPVILETAVAEMKTPQGRHRVRLFFDKGSQYSYILQTVADQANLSTVEAEVLSVNTFAKKKSEEISSDLKRVELCKGSFKISMLCNAVETVCVPLQSATLQERDHYELKNLMMADPEFFTAEKLSVDILIGNDYYQDFMSGETRHTSFGPVIIKSHLGWILSGPINNSQNAKPKNSHSNVCIINHISHRNLKTLKLDEYPLTVQKEEVINEYQSEAEVSISHLQPVNLHNKTKQHKENSNQSKNHFSCHTLLCETFKSCNDVETEKELDWFWETEHIGVLPEELEPTVLEEFEKTVQYDENAQRYIVKWPWKEELANKLQDNRRLCEKRLESLLQRLNSPGNEKLCQQYHDVINNQLLDGVIEEVPDTDDTSYRKHYSPHHPVIKEGSTTSVRVVYDGSAKAYKGAVSLNKCMHAGPSLIKELVSIMLNFRMYYIGIVADIRKAFLTMFLAEEDRDVTRFLWRENGNPSNPLKVYRFTRVPFGMTASPFLLQATLIHHINKYKERYPETARKLLESFYVDDLTSGCETVEEAKTFISESTIILKEAGMTLTKWRSCNEEVQKFIKTYIEDIEYPDDNVKTLGIPWDLKNDTFSCNLDKVIKQVQSMKPTKRNVLKSIAKVFDPLGFLAPYVITAKILMQQLSKRKLDWDTELTGDLLSTWKEWIDGLEIANTLRIPRHLVSNTSFSQLEMELIGFSDASLQGYSATVYLRYKVQGKVKVRLLISKSRVAPMRKMTIPRLELLGALLLARLMSTVKGFLHSWKFKKTTYYTDSKNVHGWIKGKDKDWVRWLKSRLNEIWSLSSAEDWYHCPGDINPADLSTRGISADQCLNSSLYYKGPPELKEIENLQSTQQISPPKECLTELRKQSTTLVTTTTNTVGNVISLNKYSSFNTLIHVTAIVLQFIGTYIMKRQSTLLQCMILAESLWIKQEQEKYHSKELMFIKDAERQVKKCTKDAAGNLVKQWSLFLDEKGLLRCRGRFEYAEMSYATKYPILLPKKSYLTMLIIADRHLTLNHAGMKQTFVQLRSEFWIPSGRRLLKDFIARCVPCRRLKAKPYQSPPTVSLPELRLSQLPPFTNTGTDFAGPVFCREMRGGEKFKSYINIFTCASTRAVHLELVSRLTTNCFLNSLDRFISRRGVPHVMVSDNAKTFKCAAQELNCIITSSSYQAHLADKRIRWFFYLEKSPWWGGFIERMVESVKSILRKVLYRALLTFEEMTTLLARVESIINSRPITYTYVDDVIEPLTPSHLLIGKRSTELPPDQ